MAATIRVDMRARLPAGVEQPDDMIGPYKLIELLGEGGFGAVWRAQQSEPIRREVALKLIKPGMDSREIITRFEAEKQTLALMAHPNIAGVLDAGTTDLGRPYFVMELVRGVPITEYCDKKKLTIRQRLELFIPVCQAVQHAHQKAILHRDLKPSNILVEEVDGQAVPRVIDFGIAKALGGTTEEARQASLVRTQEGMVIGTPQYMSPEQAGAKADIDTRSDIYTLGVILYELLTGTTPLTREQLKQSAFDEMLRLVREWDSARPSSRVLSTKRAQSDVVTQTCTARGTEPARLIRSLRGDLDWITLKALEKDRDRRYETANALAEDIRRHLNQEPVNAAAPSARYRLVKLIRRNRTAFAAAATIVVVLVAATAVSLWQAARARRAEQGTLAALQVAERHRAEALANLAQARAAVDNYLNNVTDNPRLKQADFVDLRRELLETALPFYERFIQQQSDDPALRKDQAWAFSKLGEIYVATGQPAKAETVYKRARAFQDHFTPELKNDAGFQKVLSSITSNSATSLISQGKDTEAESALRTALATQEQLAARDPADPELRNNLAITMGKLASLCFSLGRADEAEKLFKRCIELETRLVEEVPGRPECTVLLAGFLNNLGGLLHKTGRVKAANEAGQQALAILDDLGRKSPPTAEQRKLQASLHHSLGIQYRELGRPQDSVQAFQRAQAILEPLVAEFPSQPAYRIHLASIHGNLGNTLGDLGRFPESEAAFRRSIEESEKLFAEFPDLVQARGELTNTYNSLGIALARQRKFDGAEAAYRKALEVSQQFASQSSEVPDYPREIASAHTNLGTLHIDQGHFAEAGVEFRQALALREKLIRDFPEVRNNRVDLAGARHNLAMVLAKDKGAQAEARALYQQAIDLQQQELAHNPQNSLARRYLGNHHFKLSELCLDMGDHATTALHALKLAQLNPQQGAQVTAASLLARCVPLVLNGPATAERANVAESYARQAVELLRQALAIGFKELQKVKDDPAFASLRDRADFQALALPAK